MVFSDAFVASLALVRSKRIIARTRRALDLIAEYPEIGSSDLPESIREEFGDGLRKLVVPPFDIVYEYHIGIDTVSMLGLVHCRKAR